MKQWAGPSCCPFRLLMGPCVAALTHLTETDWWQEARHDKSKLCRSSAADVTGSAVGDLKSSASTSGEHPMETCGNRFLRPLSLGQVQT